MLVGPVFAAGSITNERERRTLELLLTTTLSPWQILSGKLVSSLRVSVVLTSFLVWPVLLAWLLPPWTFWTDSITIVGYLAIILVTSLTTTTLAMFCSVFFQKTSVSLMTSYLVVILLFALPIAVKLFADLFFPNEPATQQIHECLFVSPFAATFSLPLDVETGAGDPVTNWSIFTAPAFLLFYTLVDLGLIGAMLALFSVRWRAVRQAS
jgi:ABC-type transport system involved in multi-copper enzyme maturation permease subunit